MLLWLPMACLLGGLTLAVADVVYLKNGETLEGIVVKKTKQEVIVDLGFGTTKVNRNEVRRIEKSSTKDHRQMKQQWRAKFFDQTRFVPPRLKGIGGRLAELEAFRSKAMLENQHLADQEDRLERLRLKLTALRQQFLEANRELKETMVDDVGVPRYNQMIYDAVQMQSEINLTNDVIAKTEDSLCTGAPALLQYLRTLPKFDRMFHATEKNLRKGQLSRQEQDFLTGVKAKLHEFHQDFQRTEIRVPDAKSKHLVLPATINGRTIGRFLLDTGASTITMSRAFSARLGIDYSGLPEVEARLADGSRSTGRKVLLKSVEVGGAKAQNVWAIVKESSPGPGVDGLLGMSFLGRFMIHLDAKNNKLVLEKFQGY